MKFRVRETVTTGQPLPARDPLAARRSFWVFVIIFSVTIFGASAQIASGYMHYLETTRRGSAPVGYRAVSTHLASAPDAEKPSSEDETVESRIRR